ncbi:MAG: type I 3-dehydroquinate dehydratase [Treponema sp.]|nr:type I 3-dehydroquinate dehydratase [Treponema sp.]
MERPKICMTLTGSTLSENLALLEKYRPYIDMVELRADFLTDDERLLTRRFPALAGMPCLLTIRRLVDGGQYMEGEGARTVMFARALSFADSDKSKNFAYVDFEEDFHVPSLQDAALAFGTRIVRSVHDMKNPIKHLAQRLDSLRTSGFEIPKIAFMPHSLADVKDLFNEAARLKDYNHILIAMGDLGLPSRLLAAKLKNYLTFVSPAEKRDGIANLGQIDPETLNNVYHFKTVNENTKVFGITGWPLVATSSPQLHNSGYEGHNINAIYIPIRAPVVKEAVDFADSLGVRGLSVTVCHKEKVLECAKELDEKVRQIGSSNTLVREGGGWKAYNTDGTGFTTALLNFTGTKDLRGWKVSIIGAGGAAKAIAWAVKSLKAKACVFNRTLSKAVALAEKYGFECEMLPREPSESTTRTLRKYSDLIIQTTSVGMDAAPPSTADTDPLWFYDFTGKEMLFDIIYVPSETPIMKRAAAVGCKVCNGYDMLRFQGYEQFELFTGEKY